MMAWLRRLTQPRPPEQDEERLKARLDAQDYDISLRLEMLRVGTIILERRADEGE